VRFMTKTSVILAVLVGAGFSLAGLALAGEDDMAKKLEDATTILEESMSIPEKAIPTSLIEEAKGIAVIPGVVKAGLVVGGRRGEGVLVIRREDGSWGRPLYMSLTGGSVGWQVGVSSTDVILVFRTKRSVEGLLDGEFSLGADASVAAGPVGRTASAGTDVKLKAEVYSYSRSRGLFAGVSFEGAKLGVKAGTSREFYGTPDLSARGIVDSKDIKNPKVVTRFLDELAKIEKTSDAGDASSKNGSEEE
jgi:lipid-binding SYLF domain-containing protein